MNLAVKPRLVAFDVDGTLLDERQVLSERVISAILAMQERGVQGCLVTGRMYRSVLPYARHLRFDAPIVCYQGAAVVDPSSDAVLFDEPLRNREAIDLVAYAHSEALHLQLYKNDRFYCEQLNQYAKLYAKISGVEPVLVGSLEREFETSDATKAVIVAEADAAERHLPEVQALLGDRAYVTRSIPQFVEVMNPAVDKGKALSIVAKHLGVEMTEVLAIGDSWNDAPLLRAAGFGVAMGSAPQELREVADAVVADVEHDGVAEALERFVLS
ncbi:MAG: Cof-type HAD-IIB family hydrolase [Vulcanimicrobiaceae bacterium]